MASDADEAQRIRALVQRRLRTASPRRPSTRFGLAQDDPEQGSYGKRPVPASKGRDQLARWLAQRGFESDLIEQVLTDILSSPSGD